MIRGRPIGLKATKENIMEKIAGNTQHAGRTNRGYAESWTSEQLDGLLSEDWLRRMVAEIRAGDEIGRAHV